MLTGFGRAAFQSFILFQSSYFAVIDQSMAYGVFSREPVSSMPFANHSSVPLFFFYIKLQSVKLQVTDFGAQFSVSIAPF